MTDDLAGFRVVGMGPFPLPGERKRWAKAKAEAREMLRLAELIEQRQESPSEADEQDD